MKIATNGAGGRAVKLLEAMLKLPPPQIDGLALAMVRYRLSTGKNLPASWVKPKYRKRLLKLRRSGL